jgi:hypothetical protein
MCQYIGAVIAERNILVPLCILVNTSHKTKLLQAESEIGIFHKNDKFKLLITLDRHRPRLVPMQ